MGIRTETVRLALTITRRVGRSTTRPASFLIGRVAGLRRERAPVAVRKPGVAGLRLLVATGAPHLATGWASVDTDPVR
jgi:hypothetical protein